MTGRWFTIVVALIFKAVHDPERSFASARPSMIKLVSVCYLFLARTRAEKQLYASHYFETALDPSFCVRASSDSNEPGFYLIMAMGSEQAGLTGVKGSIVRKGAVGRSVSNLRDALTAIKNTLEGSQ